MAQRAVEETTQHSTASEAVVSAVAELTDTEPTSLDPLFSAIDSDALDRFFGSNAVVEGRSPNRVEFTYCGCAVVVTGDGTVRASRSGREITRRWT